jgi:hypothetical protein
VGARRAGVAAGGVPTLPAQQRVAPRGEQPLLRRAAGCRRARAARGAAARALRSLTVALCNREAAAHALSRACSRSAARRSARRCAAPDAWARAAAGARRCRRRRAAAWARALCSHGFVTRCWRDAACTRAALLRLTAAALAARGTKNESNEY